MQTTHEHNSTSRERISRETREFARDTDAWVEVLGRLGYAAKGVVYLIIGVLAIMQLSGEGGEVTGSKGALVSLNRQPYGDFLLWAMAAGLFAYTAWRWAQGFLDVENKGSDKQAWAKRGGLIISGGLYAVVAVTAVRLALDSGGGGTGGDSEQQASQAMSFPGGTWLVIAVGIGFVGTGLYQLWRALRLKFTDHWKASLSGALRTWATRISRFGISARAVVFVIMGVYIARAGFEKQAEKAKGLGETLRDFADQPWLLGIAAVGLVCYAIYSATNAIHRRIPAK